MPTDRDIEQWPTAPVVPNTTQHWVVMVNSERWPTIAQQKHAIGQAFTLLEASNLRFDRFSASRIQPRKTVLTRQQLDVATVPGVRGKPVWYAVDWDYFGQADSVPWIALQMEPLSMTSDLSEADVLLDSVGGLHEPAVRQNVFTRIEGVADNLERTGARVSSGLLIVGAVAGAAFLASKLGDK